MLTRRNPICVTGAVANAGSEFNHRFARACSAWFDHAHASNKLTSSRWPIELRQFFQKCLYALRRHRRCSPRCYQHRPPELALFLSGPLRFVALHEQFLPLQQKRHFVSGAQVKRLAKLLRNDQLAFGRNSSGHNPSLTRLTFSVNDCASRFALPSRKETRGSRRLFFPPPHNKLRNLQHL